MKWIKVTESLPRTYTQLCLVLVEDKSTKESSLKKICSHGIDIGYLLDSGWELRFKSEAERLIKEHNIDQKINSEVIAWMDFKDLLGCSCDNVCPCCKKSMDKQREKIKEGLVEYEKERFK